MFLDDCKMDSQTPDLAGSPQHPEIGQHHRPLSILFLVSENAQSLALEKTFAFPIAPRSLWLRTAKTNLLGNAGDPGSDLLSQEDSLEKGRATHSSILA